MQPTKASTTALSAAILVASLGYFVDIYDLLLFSIVRIPSLKSLGLSGSQLTDTGIMLLNTQMIGMLIGGVLWGMLGDKKGVCQCCSVLSFCIPWPILPMGLYIL